jgi:hypothetical protein
MPTRIYFTGREHSLDVEDDPERVAEALAAADHGIARLGSGDDVTYVNRATIAYFESTKSRTGHAMFT